MRFRVEARRATNLAMLGGWGKPPSTPRRWPWGNRAKINFAWRAELIFERLALVIAATTLAVLDCLEVFDFVAFCSFPPNVRD